MKEYCAEPKRYKRQGFPEAIFGEGKTIGQIIAISKELIGGGGPVMVTRAASKVYKALKKKFPNSVYYKQARIVLVQGSHKPRKALRAPDLNQSYVCVVTAGTSDIGVAEEAAVIAEIQGCRVERIYDVGVAGVHRLLEHSDKLANAACLIVCAGMEGALASVVGGLVACPVIGVPTSIGYGVSFGGVSALLTMLNSCAANVSVVNIDDGFGAGIIASLILTTRE
jgi:pyridinium-3,5-biscarboxylic acid mononucleotide synthase